GRPDRDRRHVQREPGLAALGPEARPLARRAAAPAARGGGGLDVGARARECQIACGRGRGYRGAPAGTRRGGGRVRAGVRAAPGAKKHIFFNLFNYLTFRAAGAVVTALVLAFLCGPAIIRRLRERNVGQVIRAEGPASHHAKRGTPTMGGLIIILATVVPTLLWARLDSRYVVVAVLAMLWTGAIGFIDDYLKIVRGKSQGLVARWKLIGQVTFG